MGNGGGGADASMGGLPNIGPETRLIHRRGRHLELHLPLLTCSERVGGRKKKKKKRAKSGPRHTSSNDITESPPHVLLHSFCFQNLGNVLIPL